MFYLVESGTKYADICFSKDGIPSEKILAEINEPYDTDYVYIVTDGDYQKIKRIIGDEEIKPKNITKKIGDLNE